MRGMRKMKTCEGCDKEIEKGNEISIMVGKKKLPFIVCSYECLSLYATKLSGFEDD